MGDVIQFPVKMQEPDADLKELIDFASKDLDELLDEMFALEEELNDLNN